MGTYYIPTDGEGNARGLKDYYYVFIDPISKYCETLLSFKIK